MSHDQRSEAHVYPEQNHNGGTTASADTAVVTRWLEVVYAGLEGRLVVATDADGFTGHFHTTDEQGRAAAAAQIIDLASRANVYLRATTLSREFVPTRRTDRGGAEDSTTVPGIWLDLDVLGGTHKRTDLPPTREDALSLLDGLPMPTFTIDSGGGLYIWWLFDTPLTITTAEDLQAAKQLTRGFNELVIARAKDHGWHVDNVGDLARVLRPPGTLNYKSGTPIPVVVSAHSGVRHSSDELRGVLEEHRPAATVVNLPVARTSTSSGGTLTDDIKSRWTVEQELATRGIAAKPGRKIRCPFPSHDDHSPSFHVYNGADEGWACFGSCPARGNREAAGGSVIDLVMWLDDVSLDEALTTLAPRIGREPPSTAYLPAQVAAPEPSTGTSATGSGTPDTPPAHPDLPYPPGEYPLNDAGNGRRFADCHRPLARYVYPWGGWIAWDGRRWARESGGRIAELAHATVETIGYEALQVDPDRRKAFFRWRLQSGNVNRIKNMLIAAQHICETSIDQLDARRWELNTPTGIVHLRSGSSDPHDPDRHHTKITGAAWNPGTGAPTWERFLTQVLPDPEVRAFVQRLTGAAAAGVIRDHVLPIHYGSGANGKSTFVDTVVKALGDYARPVSVQVLMEGKRNPDAPAPEIAGLRGTRLAVAQEPELGERLRESTVKHLTGGDRIVARRLYQDPVEFDPTHSLWLVTNHKPVIRGTDDGIWRRIALIPWTVTIPVEQRDPDLPKQLEDELDGVLTWIIEGAIAWARDGLQPPAQVTAATAGYRSESDRLQPWIEDRCEVAEDASEEPAALYNDYENWCAGIAEDAVSKHAFYLMLAERGFDSGKTKGRRVRKGIRISGTPEQTTLGGTS